MKCLLPGLSPLDYKSVPRPLPSVDLTGNALDVAECSQRQNGPTVGDSVSQAKAELAAYAASPDFENERSRERRLTQQLLDVLGESTAAQPLTVEAALQAPPPEISASRRVALTW